MKSIRVTVPSSPENVVSRMAVFARYARVTVCSGFVGAIVQWPLSGPPTRAAKQAPPSKPGRHSQSIEPPRLTSAAVSVLPINP